VSRCDDVRRDLGAYVLGGLEPAETHAVESHLAGCAACRAEHVELAGLPALLHLAQDAPPRAPGRVRDRVVAAAARRQLRHRWRLAAAAAAVVAAATGALVGWQLAPGAGPVEIAVPLEDVEPFEASGEVTFRPGDGTIRIRLALDSLEELEEPSVYEAWLYTTDRRVVSIGQLTDTADGLSVELVASGSLDDYRSFWVTAEPDGRDPAHDGPTVVRAAVPDVR
jgi:anti-sigma-K factor RskA